MKDLRPAVRSYLLGDAGIAAAVTAAGVARIFPTVLPQGITLPSIVQNQITETTDYNIRGPSTLGNVRIQIDCWSDTLDGSVVLGDLVNTRLSGFFGSISWGSNSPPQSVLINGIFAETARDGYDSRAFLYSRRRDFVVWYNDYL